MLAILISSTLRRAGLWLGIRIMSYATGDANLRVNSGESDHLVYPVSAHRSTTEVGTWMLTHSIYREVAIRFSQPSEVDSSL